MSMAKKTYRVKVSYTVWDVYEVQASSEAEARELAEEKANDTSLNEMNNVFDYSIIIKED